MTLILVWYAISQSYMRGTEYYPQVTIQQFRTAEECQKALATIKHMARNKLEGTCQ